MKTVKVVKAFPPNIETIRTHLGVYPDTLYCYGDTVYFPEGTEIPEDILLHEEVHINQQKQELSPELWWNKYLQDRDFREQMEVEAYAVQYNAVKRVIPVAGSAECLFELAGNLKSPRYKLNLTYGKAESLIRRKAKTIL